MTGLTPDKRWVRMLTSYFLEYDIGLPANPNVLNVGCGNNVKWNYLAVAFYLADQGLGTPHYVAIDQEKEAFADAKEILDVVFRDFDLLEPFERIKVALSALAESDPKYR